MKPQTNSIIRAFTLLDILKKETDDKHRLSQKQLLDLMREKDGSCTEKTLRTDLRCLMEILNPPVSEYESQKDLFRIRYDGIEEGRSRLSGISYVHEFSGDDLALLSELVQTCTEIGDAQRNRLIGHIRTLGSRYDTCHTDALSAIPEYSTLCMDELRANIRILAEAIKQNRRVSFVFRRYDREGRLIPVRRARYEVNPYHVVKYGTKYYLLCSHGTSEKTYIYRLDLMADAAISDETRTSIREVKELRHSDAMAYMERHLHMNYDEPRTVTLLLHRNIYTQFHDSFGSHYTVKRRVDEEHDEVEVYCSEQAIIQWAMLHGNCAEILRPKTTRRKLSDQAAALLKQYE